MGSWKIKILIDGACPLCRREARLLRWLDRGRRRLVLEDITAPGFDAARYGTTGRALMAQIHGVLPNGSLITGTEVFRRAYAAVGLGWLLAPTRWPVLRPLCNTLYAWFARNRLRLTGHRRACATGDCNVGREDIASRPNDRLSLVRDRQKEAGLMRHSNVSRVRSSGLGLMLLSCMALAAAQERKESKRMIFEFKSPQEAKRWDAVNDDVMGGVSKGRARVTDDGKLEFSGAVSLENNGGFASIRSRPAPTDLSSFDGLLIRVRGDGKRYALNLRTDVRIIAGAYRVKFDTQAGEWQELKLPFADFEATSFGRVRRDLPPLDPGKIRSFGFTISDKQAGAFKLEVDWIKAIATDTQNAEDHDAPDTQPST